jgi:nitrate reductase beta subunit
MTILPPEYRDITYIRYVTPINPTVNAVQKTASTILKQGNPTALNAVDVYI